MPRAVSAVARLLLVLALPAASQEPPSYEGTAEVVAVDAVVDLGPQAARWIPGGRGQRDPATLAATVDARPAPVVAVDGGDGPLERIVLWFDLSLSDDHQVAWAAQRLGDRARELIRRGPVEVVVAAPAPITALAPTRDRKALEEALGGIGLLSEPADELVELRLATRAGSTGGPSLRERALVQQRLDALLLSLVDRSEPPDGFEPTAPRRAVFLASGGFEPAGHEEPVATTARALAAYGWRVIPMLAPPQRGLLPGKRIGKWRGDFWGVLWATREEDRDPERAEAYLELAKALRGQGELERAAEAAEDAAFHFYGDPRTADREAAALLLAAEIHGQMGDPQRARRMLRRAARIDPGAVEKHPVMAAIPRAPEVALAALAVDATPRPVVRDEIALRQAIDSLADREVVTVQAPVAEEGTVDRLARVVLRPVGGGGEIAGAWVRLGTPAAVTEARARRGG